MRQQILRRAESGLPAPRDGVSEVVGVPVDDDRRKEIEPGDPEVLTLGRPVADLALPPDPQGALQCVVRLALVQADLRSTLHVGIEQPVNDEKRPFNPSDFAKGDSKVVPARPGCEFPQQLAGPHDSRGHGGRAAQDVRPVGDDRVFPDPAADQPFQLFWRAFRFKNMESLRREIPDAGDEAVCQQRGDGEDEIGEPARVGVLLPDPPAGPVHEQAVQDLRGFVRRGGNGLGCEGAKLVGDMGIGFQSRFAAVPGVDEVHGLALARRREELPVAGGGPGRTLPIGLNLALD